MTYIFMVKVELIIVWLIYKHVIAYLVIAYMRTVTHIGSPCAFSKYYLVMTLELLISQLIFG